MKRIIFADDIFEEVQNKYKNAQGEARKAYSEVLDMIVAVKDADLWHDVEKELPEDDYDRAIMMEDENRFIEFGSFYSESENTEPCFYDSEDKPFKAVRWFDYF